MNKKQPDSYEPDMAAMIDSTLSLVLDGQYQRFNYR